jgi:diaminopimelate epimerase
VTRGFRFLKGHGTENDFILLPDLDGHVHGDLSADVVRALCDRRAGLGADGVLRVLRQDGTWFMDYRNSDGSLAEMCGNGIRLFARYLVAYEGVESPIEIDTRDGPKTVTVDGDLITVDLGSPQLLGETKVSADGRTWPATNVSMGNPHAVAFVDDLSDAGALTDAPEHDASLYPDGVNVEFVVRRGDQHIAMRVHERGSGETRSCGTGACAAMVAAATADGAGPGTTYRVDVPGGTLEVTWREDDHVLLTGPAVIVADGNWVAEP